MSALEERHAYGGLLSDHFDWCNESPPLGGRSACTPGRVSGLLDRFTLGSWPKKL